MTGSRQVDDLGITNAKAFAQSCVDKGLTLVCGAANGADMITAYAVIQAGGNVILVLPEAIKDNVIAKHLKSLDITEDELHNNVLIVSEFSDNSQSFAYRALTRNETIVALGNTKQLVCIKAGNTGGSVACGRFSLAKGISTVVLDDKDGCAELLSKGARFVSLTTSKPVEPKYVATEFCDEFGNLIGFEAIAA
jgi:predicted Rossmann fold nucleotide-binding protein DprA/Smf involved in DNA uptake